MNKTKLFSLGLATLMLLSAAGCGKGGSGSGKNEKPSSSAEVDAVTFEGFKFDTNSKLDFGGETITVARNIVPDWGVSDSYDRELTIKDAIAEKYNAKIEYVHYNGPDFLKEVVLKHVSGQALADLVFSTSSDLLAALTNENIFRALDDYIDYSNERFALTDSATKYVDGKHYSYYPIKRDAGYFIFYNTDLLSDNNCEDPKELYEAGNWNWNTFEEIAKACTGMKNGKIIYGIAGSNILDGIVASNGLSVVSRDDSLKVNCNLFSDAGKNALNFVRKLAYEDKAVDTTYGGHNGIETFKNGYAAMLIGAQYYGSHISTSGMAYDMVPLPLGNDTETYTNLCEYCYCYSVSTNSAYDTKDLLQVAFELERNDPDIGDTYRNTDYEGKLQSFIDQYVDQDSNYADDEQAKYVYDFINSDKTVNMIEWATADIKKVIAEQIYTPIYKGEDVRSVLTSVEPVIKTSLDNQF